VVALGMRASNGSPFYKMRPRPLADLTRRRQVDAADLGDHGPRDRRAGRVPGRDRCQDLLGTGWFGHRRLPQGRMSSTAIGWS
jgi:hypothetical protein